jgi:hypothetical protein
MSERMKSQAVILNSPIEFLITGPYGGFDRVLVCSRDAGLDLIGVAANFDSRSKNSRPSDNVISVMFAGRRKLNSVKSMPFSDIDVERDSRKSSYQFVWNGFASRRLAYRIEEMFNKIAPLLKDLIARGNMEEIEWILGPMILQCSEENERLQRAKKLNFWIVGGYAFIIVATILASSVMSQLKALRY